MVAPRPREPGGGRNRYLERLGLKSLRLEDYVEREDLTFFHFMFLALLERGERMSLAEIARRLAAAGIEAATGDLERSLLKAWHGMKPVVRDGQGRFSIDLSSSALERLVWRFSFPELRRTAVGLTEAREVVMPPADVPLSEEEVKAAFAGRFIRNVSLLRQAAATLEALGRPASIEEVDAYLAALTPHRTRLTEAVVDRWRSFLIVRDRKGRLVLDPSAAELHEMRRAVRALAQVTFARRLEEENFRQESGRLELEAAAREFRQKEEARSIRRAIVRALPADGPPRVLGVLDAGSRTLRAFLPEEMDRAREHLSSFGLLAGLHIREILDALGLDPDRWHTSDLAPPRKTRRLNRQGRTLSITPLLLMSSTTRINRPLGDPRKVAQLLAREEYGKVVRRLESDLKALHAFYRYGVLHHYVRLRWGLLDETLHVDWALPGDLSLYALLHGASESSQTIELVFGSAPGWADPWSRAQAVRVKSMERDRVVVEDAGGRYSVPLRDVQAARVAAPGRGVAGPAGRTR